MIRPEIQGLRAIAVSVVLVFHVWPDVLPGGYVGVDVFFVISGFLITSLLVREAEANGRIRFGEFYLRRAKRLLPVATLVLAFVALATPLVLPASQWRGTALEILASVFYVENWRLAYMAVDYLGAEEAPSPVQHFWSLAVEEQFYLFWPALLALCLAVSRGKGFGKSLPVAVSAVFLASLAFSVVLTESDPGLAYFFTHTRVWELALGAMLAVLSLPRMPALLREALSLAGLALIAYAALFYSGETRFPGYAALLPTMGAAFVILAGESGSRLNPASVLSSRPFQFVGDASYSIYLWHWPFVVFALSENEAERIGWFGGLVLICAVLGVSALSKVHVEDRFRRTGVGSGAVRPELLRSVAIGLVPALCAALLLVHVLRDEAGMASGHVEYPGARAIGTRDAYADGDFIPVESAIKRDRSEVYENDCHAGFKETVPVPCRYGRSDARFNVFLVGDSHAVNWLPALQEIAEEEGWSITTYTKSSCALMPVMIERSGGPYEECLEWGKEVLRSIVEDGPDLVVFTQMHNVKTYAPEGEDAPSLTGALVSLWREIESNGPQVVAIADIPQWKRDPDKCLLQDRNCHVPLDSILDEDPLRDAQERERNVGLVDMNDIVCPDARCSAVVGRVVVWRDRHHITATYSRSTAGILKERIEAAMARSTGVAGGRGPTGAI